MNALEKFKNECVVKSISDFLMTQNPIPKLWGFPPFLKNDANMLSNFFGEAYKYYNVLSSQRKYIKLYKFP